MAIELSWMRRDAPYMAIATAGLLSLLPGARARWTDVLQLETELSVEQVAEVVHGAPVPDVDGLAWPTGRQQGLDSALGSADDPLALYMSLCEGARGTIEERLLRVLGTDQVRRAPGGAPGRNRLLRGAKSDLSAFRWRGRGTAAELADELRDGLRFVGADSGPCMGLAPEVHTLGGTVGRSATTIGAASPLLAVLLRHGLLALPPNGCRSGRSWTVGGPLLDSDHRLSWPIWSIPLDLRALRVALCWGAVHDPDPDGRTLAARGVTAVYRSTLISLSDTVSVYRWGKRVA